MLTEAPPAKVARLSFREGRHAEAGSSAQTRGSSARDSGPGGGLRRALQAWAAERRSGSAPPAAAPSAAGTKEVLREATEEMVLADRLGRLGHRTEQDGGPEPPRSVVDAMSRARALLQHFWASKWSEAAMRSRLVREMASLASMFDEWQKAPQGLGAVSRDGGGRGGPLARRGARSFLSPIRRAIDIQGSG
uniref:Uncharacterized protein n=2 Tax=Alexandrium monilatum TaxID=311494 RepID=A0A7S4Q2U9_9DINO